MKHTPRNAHARTRPPTSALMLGVALAWSLFAGACSSPHGAGSPHQGERELITGAPARSVPIVMGADGRPVTWNDLIIAAASADVVILGENHGHVVGLSAAAALWEDVLARSDRAALAMEFIERDEQAHLDDYLTGVVDEATFIKKTGRTDSNYPPGHRAMVDAAKARQRPVYAANAPRVYVRLARTDGYERLASLTSEQRRLFRIPDELTVRSSRYRQDFGKIMGEGEEGRDAHGAPLPKDDKADAEKTAAVDATFRAQSMWDWTMAESVANAAAADGGGGGGNAPVALVVGHFHCDFDGGLVQALRKLRPGVRVVVVSFIDAAPPQSGTMREEDRGRGEFVVYVGEGKEKG